MTKEEHREKLLGAIKGVEHYLDHNILMVHDLVSKLPVQGMLYRLKKELKDLDEN